MAYIYDPQTNYNQRRSVALPPQRRSVAASPSFRSVAASQRRPPSAASERRSVARSRAPFPPALVYLSNRWPLVHCLSLEDEEVAPPLSQIDLQRSAGLLGDDS